MPAKGKIKANAKPRTVKERAYDATPARKKARAERNRKRRQAIKKGTVKVGDNKVVNHKKPIATNGVQAAKTGGTSIQTQKASDKSGSKVRTRKYGKKAK